MRRARITSRSSFPEAHSSAVEYDWSWGSHLAGLRLRRPLGTATIAEVRIGWTDFRTALDSWWGVGGLGEKDQTVRARGCGRRLAERSATG